MPSIAELTGPSDEFFLAAHDGVKCSRVLADRPLGIGLATGLLAALVRGDWCQLWDGELFRTGAGQPRDEALYALLARMEEDEQDWPPPPIPPAPRTYIAAHARTPYSQAWTPEARDDWRAPPVPQETRPAGSGHQVREWMAYLANKRRAEALVGDRLASRGLVWREERGLPGFRSVRYVPRDTIVTGNPASKVRTAAERGSALPWSGLFLAGLFLATGLHQHALATLKSSEHSTLQSLLQGLDEQSLELLKTAQDAVGNAAAVR